MSYLAGRSEAMPCAVKETPFFETIYQLRTGESVVLYDGLLRVSDDDNAAVVQFLEAEFDNEALDLPYTAPAFDPAAALWGAATLYRAAQLVLNRGQAPTALEALFPACPSPPSPAAMLSADLCLRFLPALVDALHRVALDDALIPILETPLRIWHYSAIGHGARSEALSGALAFDAVLSDPCLRQGYVDRVIRRRDRARAVLPELAPFVRASLGAFPEAVWPGGPFS